MSLNRQLQSHGGRSGVMSQLYFLQKIVKDPSFGRQGDCPLP